ncbi:MAG: D-tyrosyl-tRNA(Tyr) deacylase [Deltaproteobacteria bacterium]|nr:D-tyrosyl-tRNA(Tyr) deacylase [Deltaproteobacteria bacterium]
MRAVVQRVSRACVCVDGEMAGEIGPGLCVLIGISTKDKEADALWMSEKLLNLRILNDLQDKPNLSIRETGGAILLISQFTLLGDARTGRRPSYTEAAKPEHARPLFDRLAELCREGGTVCATGRFGAHMQVELVNDGPFTILLDSAKLF